MISQKYVVRYTPQKLEEVEEIVWSVMSCDETSANVIVKNDDIIITAYYEDEYLHSACEKSLLQRIKGLKIKEVMNLIEATHFGLIDLMTEENIDVLRLGICLSIIEHEIKYMKE